jgi:deoxyribodipyrimidine photolyase-related protein
MQKQALVILGDQLFPIEKLKDYHHIPIFMAEDVGLCSHFKYHKHKLIFFLASMRNYADELRQAGFNVFYSELSDIKFTQRLDEFLTKKKIKEVLIHEVNDKFFETELLNLISDLSLKFEFLSNPMFLSTRKNFESYLKSHSKPFMKTFYEGERKRLKIMLDNNGKPWGGQWSYDEENRKKAPKDLHNKSPLIFEENEHLQNVKMLIDTKFPDHPGVVDNFWLPVTRKDSLKSLDHFLSYHFKDYGAYQDAITDRDQFLYHSLLSPMINNGMLLPDEVIQKAIQAYEKENIPLASLEGFIRQVMGWREFVFGIYRNFSEEEDKRNFFKHQRQLTSHWYEGTTGLPPLDDAINKAQDFGYCHHIERLMILSNVMLLTEIHPQEVHRWFMEMFVDSADWVMGPNVYGMGQFSDGGIFATKPYFSGSNYILKMSDYKKGEWCDIWDGLFWRFIGKHSDFFAKQYRLSFMVQTFNKMDAIKKKRLLSLAEDFIHAKSKA